MDTLMIILVMGIAGDISVSTTRTGYKICKKVERSYKVSLPANIKSVDVRCIK
ncbi:MAG: hypothetical protein U9O64_05660 [Campylobacterota bacterium]|nr:hypothetical protein [Campylobacterota bacterium]